MFAPIANLLRAAAATAVVFVACLTSAEGWTFTEQAPKSITDYGTSVWKQSEGLPNNSLRAVLQTRDGYLWVGTKGGLARFNGNKFVTYSARASGQLAESEVRALVEGNDGSLYIGTMGGGLSILKDGKFTTLRKTGGLPHDAVRALCRGDDGSIWVGTDGGLGRLRAGTLKTFNDEAGLLGGVRALLTDRQGRIWVGTRSGLFMIDGDTVVDRSREGPVGAREISAMAMDTAGQLFVATSDRSLFRSNGDSFALIPKELTPGDRIESLHVDAFGHLWMGTFDGVYRLTGDRLEQYPRVVSTRSKSGYIDAVPISDVWSISSDREGNIWLGSSESGLIKLRSGHFQGITTNDGLPSPWVNNLVESADGTLYVGTASGLAIVRGDDVAKVSLGTEAKPCVVMAVAPGEDGAFLVGSDCGLFSGQGDQFAKVPLPQQADERVFVVSRSRDGNLWLGYTTAGLLRVSPGGEKRWFTTENGLLSNGVRTAMEDKDGTLLVGGLLGINQIKGDQVTTLKGSANEVMGAVYDIITASDGVLWFATRRGLVRHKDGSDVLLPAGHGLPAVEFFYQIVEDAIGYFWLTSSVGIFRVSLADLNALADGQDKDAAVSWFTDEDGMPSAACPLGVINAAITCQGGQLCFATTGGVAIVDPNRVSPSQYAPPMHIESVIFDGNPVAVNTGVVLGPGRNDIKFDYAGLEYAFPHRMRFRYRLNGRDQGWSEPVDRRTVNYTNLAPGNYRFEVVASNSDGVWSDVPATFGFRIAPRFYQTRSFYILSTLVLLGLVAFVIRWRTRQLKLRTIELEEMVQKRTEAITQRNQDMRLVLDNVSQGLLTVDAQGTLAAERSAIIDRWFGSYPPDTQLVDFMGRVDRDFADRFQFAFDVLARDTLPLELAVAQLPSRIKHEGSEYASAYTALLKGEKPAGLLVVINDVTAELLHQKTEAERKELLSVFESLTRDRLGFLAFFDEASEMLQHVAQAGMDAQKGGLHTLKGNAGLIGLGVVASLCHQLEEQIATSGLPLTSAALGPLQRRWQELSDALSSFLGAKGRDVVELSLQEVELLATEVRAGASPDHVLDRLASWLLEDAERPLARLGRQAGALAERMGKGALQMDIQTHGIRLAPKTWAGFWAELAHVVRNAVDHGVEWPHERRQSGKTAPPQMRLSVCITAHKLVVAVEDNGRGIDWAAVRRAATKLNLPNQTQDDLVNCLFVSGMTTRDEVTTISGRGVGLAAVRRQVEDRGGTISVTARRAEGTCVRCEFPLQNIGPRFGIDPGDLTC